MPDFSEIGMVVLTSIAAVLAWIRRADAARISVLERESSEEKTKRLSMETRVEKCEEDRRNLREQMVAGERGRMDLAIQLNTALLALNAATEQRGRGNERGRGA